MMDNEQTINNEKNVLRWGGLAGLVGGILFMLAWVVVIFGPVGMEDPAELAGWVTRFPDIQMARVVENGIYLTAIILQVMLFLALYRALREASLAPALFGSVIGIVGLVVFMVGSVPHVAHDKLFALSQAPGATPADQAAIALMWQAIWGLIDAFLYVGFFVVPIGILLLGVAMLGSPTFGKGFGWMSVALGVVALACAALQMADPASDFGAITYFACLIFYLVQGGKLLKLSRS